MMLRTRPCPESNRAQPSGVARVQHSGCPCRYPCDLRHASPGRRLRKMTRNCRRLVRGAWLPIALLVAAGCKQGPSPEVQARIDSLSQASSQRDRLMQEVAENTRLVSEISRELARVRSEEHTSELQSPCNLVCRLLLEKKNKNTNELRANAFGSGASS